MEEVFRRPLLALLALGLTAALGLAFDAYRSPVMMLLLDGFLLCG